jgi:hypothetical protein
VQHSPVQGPAADLTTHLTRLLQDCCPSTRHVGGWAPRRVWWQ